MRPTAAFVPPPVSGEGEGQVEEKDSVILTNPPLPTGSSGSLTSPMALAICPPLQEAGTLCGGHWGLRGESGGGWSLGWGIEGVLGSALGIGQWLPPKA